MDNHIPQLSVLETMQFAHMCQHGSTPELFNIIDQIEAAILKAGFTASTTQQGAISGLWYSYIVLYCQGKRVRCLCDLRPPSSRPASRHRPPSKVRRLGTVS